MSSHPPSASKSPSSFFGESHTFFSTKQAEKSNLLDAGVHVGHNIVDATVGTVSKYIKDILNPAWAAAKNAGSIVSPSAYREYGIKALPKAVFGTVSHTATSVMNILTGIPRGLDHAYTRGVTDSIVDVANGVTDRIPLIGKVSGNLIKVANTIIAGPLRFLGRILPEKTLDSWMDWANQSAIVQTKTRHLTTGNSAHTGAHTSSSGHH